MEYSAVHNSLLIKQDELQRFSAEIRYAMSAMRKALDVPLSPRDRDPGEGLKPIDHIERAILDACKQIGVSFGVEWGDRLDLSEFK